MPENNIIEEDTKAEYRLSPENEPFGVASSAKSFFQNRISNRVVLFLLAALLFALAFLPMAYTEARLENGIEAKIEYSAFDTLRVAGSSVRFLTVKNANNSRPGLELDRLYAELNSNRYGKGSTPKEALHKAIAENELLVTLRFRSVPIRVSYIAAAAVGAIYIIASFVALVSSFGALIYAIANRHKVSDGRDKRFDRSVSMLWLITLILPALAFTVIQMCDFGSTGPLAQFNAGGRGLAYGFIIAIAAAALGSLLYLVKYLRELRRSNKGSFTDKAKVDFKSCVLALVLAACTFLPVAGVGLVRYTAYSYSEKTLYMDVYDVREINLSDMQKYTADSRLENLESLERYRDLALLGKLDGYASVSADVYNTIVFGYGRIDVRFINIALILVNTLLILVAAFTIKATFKNLFFNCENRKKIKTLKILLFILSLAYFGLSTVLVVVGKSSITGNAEYYSEISMGIGPVIAIALAIWILFTLRSRKISFIDVEYDNADVSYAPYVIKKN